MIRKTRLLTVCALVASLTVALAAYRLGRARASGIPVTDPLYYTGTLEENGVLVDGPRNLRLTIWDDAVSTDYSHTKCSTVASNTTIQKGQFRVALDPSCLAALHGSADTWVEIEVSGASLGRTKIGSVPYAVEADRASNGVPVGAIMPYYGKTAPGGWLIADGSKISKATNPGLAALVAHLRGLPGATLPASADEAMLPDLRGVFLRGQNLSSSRNPEPGADTIGLYQADAFAAHGHTLGAAGGHNHTMNSAGAHNHGGPLVGLNTDSHGSGGTGNIKDSTVMGTDGAHTHTLADAPDHVHALGNAGGTETRPKNVTVLYMIKT